MYDVAVNRTGQRLSRVSGRKIRFGRKLPSQLVGAFGLQKTPTAILLPVPLECGPAKGGINA